MKNCHILSGNSYVHIQVHYFVAWIWLHHQLWVAKSMLNPSFIPYLRCLDLFGPGPDTQVFGAAEEQAELEARKGFEGGTHTQKMVTVVSFLLRVFEQTLRFCHCEDWWVNVFCWTVRTIELDMDIVFLWKYVIEFYWYIWYILDIYHRIWNAHHFQMYLSMCDTIKLDWIKVPMIADVGSTQPVVSGWVMVVRSS